MCDCGCNTCETKSTALVLNESVAPKTILSEGLKYHIDNNRPLTLRENEIEVKNVEKKSKKYKKWNGQ